MTITIRNKEYDLKFTYNSFKYLRDFDIAEIGVIDKKPFKILEITEELLLGAVNHDKKVVVRETLVSEYIENLIEEEGDIAELLETLVDLLQESSFFKSLQKKKK